MLLAEYTIEQSFKNRWRKTGYDVNRIHYFMHLFVHVLEIFEILDELVGGYP